MTEALLKPCPFCGSHDVKSGGDDKVVGSWCQNCGAQGPNGYQVELDWNNRPIEVGSSTDTVDKAEAWDAVAAARKDEKQKRNPIETELIEALKWYRDQAEGCRKLSSVGDPFRQALNDDGGRKAKAAIQKAEGK